MSVKKNVVANYVGQAWASLIGLAFVPLYIRYLGVEAYGLIGIFGLMQAWFALLDMGMTPTLNREMARFTAGAHSPQSIRDLLRSLEVVCFSVAGSIALVVWIASEWLATDWLRTDQLSLKIVAQAIAVMGVVVALRFAEGIYRGSMLGLQRQVFLSSLNASLATGRAAGSVAVLVWISPTITAFFIWQGIMSLFSIIILAFAAKGSLPKSPQPARFSKLALISVRNFAFSMMATTVLATLLTQVDKVLLSKLITLSDFGYYTLAVTASATIGLLITPVVQAVYPRLTQLVSKDESRELVHVFHLGSQLVTALATPIALMLIFFGNNLVVLWTGDIVLAVEVSPLLALLAVGTLLNGLMHIPYMLQLAHGWPGLAVKTNLGAVAVLVPAIIWVTPRHGAVGAAWVWVLLNAGYLLISIHYMFRRLLPNEKWIWYWNDTFRPICAAALVATFLRWSQPKGLDKPVELIWLAAVGLTIFCVVIVFTTKLKAPVTYIIMKILK